MERITFQVNPSVWECLKGQFGGFWLYRRPRICLVLTFVFFLTSAILMTEFPMSWLIFVPLIFIILGMWFFSFFDLFQKALRARKLYRTAKETSIHYFDEESGLGFEEGTSKGSFGWDQFILFKETTNFFFLQFKSGEMLTIFKSSFPQEKVGSVRQMLKNAPAKEKHLFSDKDMSNTIKADKVIIIVVALVFFALIACYIFALALRTWYYPIGSVELAAIQCDQGIISTYIQENDGNFPLSENDLINQGFLRKVELNGGDEYFLKLGSSDRPDKGYYKRPNFKLLKISYGAEVERIKVYDGKLYDKSTNEQILLIDGPYKRWLQKKCYERISAKWYGLMLEEKPNEKQGN